MLTKKSLALVNRQADWPPAGRVVAAYVLACLILVADQATKYAIQEFTAYGWSIQVTAFFNLAHVWNYGAAFSLLADAGGWQRYFFGLLAAGVAAWLILEMRKPLPAIHLLGYASLLGGALGNGVDRVWRGYVVDFLDFHGKGWHWPAFNLADIAIVCGVGRVLLVTFTRQPAGAS